MPQLQRTRLTTLRRGGPIFYTSTFTQSLGSELVTNGNFATWSGDNPSSWSVSGESGSDPEITERAPNAGHGDPVGAGGAANLYSSATNNSPQLRQAGVLTVGSFYQLQAEVTNYVAGSFNYADLSEFGNVLSGASARVFSRPYRASHTTLLFKANAAPTDITVDDLSVKLLTLNSFQSVIADGRFEIAFILPVSPVAGEETHINYRIDATGGEFYNCWDAYLRRNVTNDNYDFRLDSISNGTRTNRINVTDVGNSGITGIRVIASGNDHTCYTLVGATATQRGSTITNSTHAANTGLNTIYSTSVTLLSLGVWIS